MKIKTKEIETKTKLKIFGLGFMISLLFILMIWAFYSRVINDIVLGMLDTNSILLLIVIGLLAITGVVSVLVGIGLTEDVSKRSVYLASGVAILVSFIILLGVCYFGLAIVHPDIYSELEGFELIMSYPLVIMYFSIYVLGNSFIINIVFIVIYYAFFLTFLDTFYEYEMEYKHYDSIFKQFQERRL